jgi:DNA-binding Lrp family transcriptional regulator
MEGHNSLDPIDRNILRILSLYEALDLLQLWYELGESDGAADRMTREEVLERLESLSSRGFVKPIKKGDGTIRWVLTLKGEVDK